MNKKYTTILRIGAFASLILIVAAIGLGLHNKSMAAYSAKLEEADRMLADEDYTNAVLKYQEAISDKPKEEQGYLKLCVAYELSGRDDDALRTINNGLAIIPGSEKLLAKKNELANAPGKSIEDKELLRSIDIVTLTSLSSKTYSDYGLQGEIEKVTSIKDGAIKVRVKNVNADLIFRNTSDQPHAVSGNAPNSGSIPDEVIFDDILAVFGGNSSLTADEIRELGINDLKIISHREYGKAVTFTYDQYEFTIESDADGRIEEGASNSVMLPSPSAESGADKEVTGTVINAVTGNGIAGVHLSFQQGRDAFDTTTDSSGSFQIKLKAGEYSVNCKANGFVEETKSAFVPSNTSEWSCEFVLSPTVAQGEARFVLTWGAYPSDLDSYLVDGSGTIITSYYQKSSASASLDVDDIDGYGPETTTLKDLNGKYRFVVHDFTASGDLGSSGAQVVVYLPGQEPVTVSISGSAGPHESWVVCEIDNGRLNVINRIEDLGSTAVDSKF